MDVLSQLEESLDLIKRLDKTVDLMGYEIKLLHKISWSLTYAEVAAPYIKKGSVETTKTWVKYVNCRIVESKDYREVIQEGIVVCEALKKVDLKDKSFDWDKLITLIKEINKHILAFESYARTRFVDI